MAPHSSRQPSHVMEFCLRFDYMAWIMQYHIIIFSMQFYRCVVLFLPWKKSLVLTCWLDGHLFYSQARMSLIVFLHNYISSSNPHSFS